jgi:hypothetical protein
MRERDLKITEAALRPSCVVLNCRSIGKSNQDSWHAVFKFIALRTSYMADKKDAWQKGEAVFQGECLA